MSRQLPPQPNLEHLKKQAKLLLHELQQHNPELKLADAQHRLAREYGFASWPRLNAYVSSLPHVNPLAGTWTANLFRSKRHPSNPFQNATLHIVVSGDTVTITDVVVDEAGREEQRMNEVVADGKERVAGKGSGYSLIATWRSPRVLETVGKKDGQVIGRGTYAVSADGMTLIISGDEQLIVFERQLHSIRP
ncbi:MAG: hypothetical protein ACRENP_26525 [Longimicrobiales bacterium]